MKITNLDRVEKVRVDMEGAEKAYKQVPISRNDGAPTFSFRVFTVEPGGHTTFHSHAFEHVNYVIRGRGFVVTENGAKRPVAEGDFVLVLPNEVHQYRNEEDRPLVLICAVPKEYE